MPADKKPPSEKLPPNRLRIVRERAGISSSDILAQMVGTTGPTIRRLENGTREFTPEWQRRIAAVLKIRPDFLLLHSERVGIHDDAAPLPTDDPRVAQKGLRKYRVLTDAIADFKDTYIDEEGVIVVDMTAEAIADKKSGDVLLLRLVDVDTGIYTNAALRVFAAPGTFFTASPDPVIHRIDDIGAKVEVLGVLLRNEHG